MRPLIVRVEDLETGDSFVYMFESGPIMLGRGNDVALRIARSYLSLQHGSFDFDEGSVSFVDLDSRNGTMVDGVILAGEERPLTEASEIRIGPLRLTASHRIPDSPPPDPTTSPFARPRISPKQGSETRSETDVLSKDLLAAYRDKMPRTAQPAPPPTAAAAAAPTRQASHAAPSSHEGGGRPAAKPAAPMSLPLTPGGLASSKVAYTALPPPSQALPPEPAAPFRGHLAARPAATGPTPEAPAPMAPLYSPAPEPLAQQPSPLHDAQPARLIAKSYAVPSPGPTGNCPPQSPLEFSPPTPGDAWPPPRDPTLPPTTGLPDEARQLASLQAPPPSVASPGTRRSRGAMPPTPGPPQSSKPAAMAGETRVIPTLIAPAESDGSSPQRSRRSERTPAPIPPPLARSPGLGSSFWLWAAGGAMATLAVALVLAYVLGFPPRR